MLLIAKSGYTLHKFSHKKIYWKLKSWIGSFIYLESDTKFEHLTLFVLFNPELMELSKSCLYIVTSTLREGPQDSLLLTMNINTFFISIKAESREKLKCDNWTNTTGSIIVSAESQWNI